MEEIRTRIDDVFEFIHDRGITTKKELSRELELNGDELEKFINILKESRLIEVRYALTDTYLSLGEETIATSY